MTDDGFRMTNCVRHRCLFVNDTLLVVGSTQGKEFPLWMSTNPTKGEWKELLHKSEAAAWDPQIFWDKDKDEVYEY